MSKKSMKVLLLVEDNQGDARLLREMFNEQGSHKAELTHVECMSAAEKHLAERAVDIIVLDLGLPDATLMQPERRFVCWQSHTRQMLVRALLKSLI